MDTFVLLPGYTGEKNSQKTLQFCASFSDWRSRSSPIFISDFLFYQKNLSDPVSWYYVQHYYACCLQPLHYGFTLIMPKYSAGKFRLFNQKVLYQLEITFFLFRQVKWKLLVFILSPWTRSKLGVKLQSK